MIEIDRSSRNSGDAPVVKILGVGGAGSNALDRLVLDGVEAASLVAVNTDVQALTSSVANGKIQIGRSATRGLGAGGDPELGFSAAHEAAEELREALSGAEMVLVCAGLGGGTGSGAAPVAAQLAKEQGALVVVFATLPFGFEGKRRGQQAAEALEMLEETADVVVCFENDKMGDIVAPKAGVHQAFAAADQTISQSVRAILNVVSRAGLIQIGFDDLAAALRNRRSRALFGYGESDGDNRAHEALARALKNPLMDRGRMLDDARSVLVNIVGGPGMTLGEVQTLMEELNRHINDDTRILFGAAVDARMGERMAVTIISSIGADEAPQSGRVAPQSEPIATRPPAPQVLRPQTPAPEVEPAIEEDAVADEAEPMPIPEVAAEAAESRVAEEEAPPEEKKQETLIAFESAAPARPPRALREKLARPEREPAASPVPAAPKVPQQETLQFEPVTRGRFEKSEPTIVDGQDLDVPTFLRRNVKVK